MSALPSRVEARVHSGGRPARRRWVAAALVTLALHAILAALVVRVRAPLPVVRERIQISVLAPVAPPATPAPSERIEVERARPANRAHPVDETSAPAPVDERADDQRETPAAPPEPVRDLAPRRAPLHEGVPTPSERVLEDVVPSVREPTTADRARALAELAPDPHTRPRRVVVLGPKGTRDVIDDVVELVFPKTDVVEAGGGEIVLRRESDGTLHYHQKRFDAYIARDGSVRFEDAPPVKPGPIPLLTWDFDINEPLLRAAGQDPFEANKICFLESTRALRETLSARDRVDGLVKRLQVLLASNVTPAEMKRAVVDAWDDCSEPAARDVVRDFVRAHMRLGTANAFTAEELAEINRGRAAPFEPYS